MQGLLLQERRKNKPFIEMKGACLHMRKNMALRAGTAGRLFNCLILRGSAHRQPRCSGGVREQYYSCQSDR